LQSLLLFKEEYRPQGGEVVGVLYWVNSNRPVTLRVTPLLAKEGLLRLGANDPKNDPKNFFVARIYAIFNGR